MAAAAILKNRKVTYLLCGLRCFDKSWHSDAVRRSWPYGSSALWSSPSNRHCQCWIENLSDLLSLQYKQNKGKFAASNGRLKAKSFSAPDPRYRPRLAFPRSPWAPFLTPTFLYVPRPLFIPIYRPNTQHFSTETESCHSSALAASCDNLRVLILAFQ